MFRNAKWIALLLAMALCLGPAMAQDAERPEPNEDEGWVSLFNGEDLTGWRHARNPEGENHWFVDDGLLTNDPDQNDLATEDEWRDFELLYEYRTVPGGNSGVYLRGRVEIQVLDSSGAEEPGPNDDGAIYNIHAPAVLASNPIGEWNEAYVRYVDNEVTVVLNGHVIHDEAEVNDVTGGALPGGVNDPGPIMLQGDHGKVWYRNLYIRSLDEE